MYHFAFFIHVQLDFEFQNMDFSGHQVGNQTEKYLTTHPGQTQTAYCTKGLQNINKYGCEISR
jgi:hypothetical protein